MGTEARAVRGRVAFLTAEWRHLLMLNFVVEPDMLEPLVPSGTDLDLWDGCAYVSVVGFLFLGSRLWGVPVPLHSRFEEINLRFYVKRDTPGGRRRGVVFVREFVPKRAVAGVARGLYGEPYTACATRHRIETGPDGAGSVEYRWRLDGAWNSIRAVSSGPPMVPVPGSEEEFITEHYWGYTALERGRCREYEVRHPPWRVQRADSSSLECNVAEVYGPRFVDALARKPSSAFVAEGSEVAVHRGRVLAETIPSSGARVEPRPSPE